MMIVTKNDGEKQPGVGMKVRLGLELGMGLRIEVELGLDEERDILTQSR